MKSKWLALLGLCVSTHVMAAEPIIGAAVVTGIVVVAGIITIVGGLIAILLRKKGEGNERTTRRSG